MTGSRALDFADVAAILADLHGRPVERRIITHQDQARRMAAAGAPPAVSALMLGMYRAARAGEFAAVDPTLATLLGRPPTTLRELLGAANDAGGR